MSHDPMCHEIYNETMPLNTKKTISPFYRLTYQLSDVTEWQQKLMKYIKIKQITLDEGFAWFPKPWKWVDMFHPMKLVSSHETQFS